MTSDSLKKIVFGKPLKSSEMESEKMQVWKALPILSSDALSSVAYGTEQILLSSLPLVIAAFAFSLPIAISIIALILLLVLSYRQVIEAYPMGGGAYMVTKENLGMVWGRLTGVSLLIDYTLTVAVSISAGVQAITSAFPSAVPYIVPINDTSRLDHGLAQFARYFRIRNDIRDSNVFFYLMYTIVSGQRRIRFNDGIH